MEVNGRFVIHNDYSSLPVKVGALSCAINNDFKQLIVMNAIVFSPLVNVFPRKAMGL